MVISNTKSLASRGEAFDKDRMQLDWTHTARVPDKGLFVREVDLNGADIFRVQEFPGWILCTDRAKTFVEDRRLTNVTFLEYGDIL